jgi:drug/metabolite transporter (DMT)-like permease
MGLFIIILSGFTGAFFSLGYKFRKQFGFSITQLIFLFSLFLTLFSIVFILIFEQPFFSKPVLFLGLLMGTCFALAIYFYHHVIDRANLNISWTVIQFSVLIPFFFSILFYGEEPGTWPLIGVVLIFASIVLFGIKNNDVQKKSIPDIRTGILLFFAALFTGINHSIAKVYAIDFGGDNTFSLFLYNGITMSIITGLLVVFKKDALPTGKKRIGIILNAAYMGVFSLSGIALLIAGLKTVDGSLAYPLRNAINIILVFIFSFWFYKEKARTIELVGVAIALAGIIIVSATTNS